MRLGLSTGFAAAVAQDPDRVLDLCQRAGAEGLMLDGSLGEALLGELATRLRARRDELPVWCVENPCPRRAAGSAELCARDREEAAVALAVATETLRLASELGADVVAVRLGEVARLKSAWPHVRRAFVRGQLDDDARAARDRERAALGQAHLDAARRALDRLARVADGLGLRLGVRNPARYIALPSATELRMLLVDLAGAPIVPLWDQPAMALAEAFGASRDEVITAWQSAPVALVGDACGAVAGLGAGAGELDLARLHAALSDDARAVFTPWGGLDGDEVVEAMASLRVALAARVRKP